MFTFFINKQINNENSTQKDPDAIGLWCSPGIYLSIQAPMTIWFTLKSENQWPSLYETPWQSELLPIQSSLAKKKKKKDKILANRINAYHSRTMQAVLNERERVTWASKVQAIDLQQLEKVGLFLNPALPIFSFPAHESRRQTINPKPQLGSTREV